MKLDIRSILLSQKNINSMKSNPDFNLAITNLAITLDELDEVYNSQEIDEEDSTLELFIENHGWLYNSELNLYINKEEAEWSLEGECLDFILNNFK